MSLKVHAILNIECNIQLLPIWLDYHKHIFDSGVVVFNDADILESQHIVGRFFPEWTFHKASAYPISSSRYYENETTGECICTLFLSTNEFLLSSSKYNIAECIQKGGLPTKVNAMIESREVPNNIVDFVSNLSFSSDRSDGIEVSLLIPFDDLYIYENIPLFVYRRLKEIESSDYIYYLDAYVYSNYDWGEDRVILREDTNLLENTDFNDDGHEIFSLGRYYNEFLKSMVESKIAEVTSRKIDLERYHSHINDEDHTRIINAMPWKKTESPEIQEFAEYMEFRVSGILGRQVKIFNDDIWVRICRPSSVTNTDYNPCHRDIYLDFYRNIVNIYVPIVGSNEKSSLAMQSGSHLWNERDLVVTQGGAYFPSSGKKYSVDAILRSKQPLHMIQPNPREDEFILFSPYLIHGCSSNDNDDTTRMSVEIRFIADDENAKIQEDEFNTFLKERVWR